MVVDGAVVMVENIIRHLNKEKKNQSKLNGAAKTTAGGHPRGLP